MDWLELAPSGDRYAVSVNNIWNAWVLYVAGSVLAGAAVLLAADYFAYCTPVTGDS